VLECGDFKPLETIDTVFVTAEPNLGSHNPSRERLLLPETRRQACVGGSLDACEMACHIAGTRVDPQQVWRASHHDAKGPVRARSLSQVSDVFAFGGAERLAQAASDGCSVLVGNHEVLPRVPELLGRHFLVMN
jgi:hypothetical protein